MSEKPQSTYRLDIQGLRALAVLAVIANHFSKTILPNGFLGVDVFFVISGYVITSLLCSSQQTSFAAFITEFYERRIKRLFPALLLCVLVTTLFTVFFIAPWQNQFYGPAWHTGFAALAGLSNLYLLSLSVDYFGGSAELNPFTQTWSLGVEEQFYLLYPVLFWTIHRFFSKSTLIWVMLALSIASLFAYITVNQSNAPAAFYLMPTRFWQLGLGCLTYLLADKLQTKSLSNFALVILIFVVAALGSWPLISTLLVTWLTVILLACYNQNSISHKILSCKPATYIGAISYPLYLWHWSVLSLSRWTIGIDAWTAPLQLALIFALAIATHHWLERPLKNLRWSDSKLRTIGIGLAALAASLCVVFILCSPLKGKFYLGEKNQMLAAAVPSQELASATEIAKTAITSCNLTPDDLTGDHYQIRPVADAAFYSKCLSSTQPKIILTGDSFAETVAPHIALISRRLGREFKTVMGYGCPFPFTLQGPFAVKTNCKIDIDFMRQHIVENVNRGDIVILRLSLAKPQYVVPHRQAIRNNLESLLSIYDAQLELFRSAIESKGAGLLLVGANLTQEFSPACLNRQWFNSKISAGCDQGITFDSMIENKLSVAFDKHLAKQMGANNYFSIIHHLCDSKINICKSSSQGTYLYDDASHLNATAISLFADDLELAIKKLMP